MEPNLYNCFPCPLSIQGRTIEVVIEVQQTNIGTGGGDPGAALVPQVGGGDGGASLHHGAITHLQGDFLFDTSEIILHQNPR